MPTDRYIKQKVLRQALSGGRSLNSPNGSPNYDSCWWVLVELNQHFRQRFLIAGAIPGCGTVEKAPDAGRPVHPLSSAAPIRRVALHYSQFFAGTSEECNKLHQKTNGAARHMAHRPAYSVGDVTKGLSLCHIIQLLFLTIRNRLVNKFVERSALLGGADGAHDGLPYDVSVLIDNVGSREREQV